MEVVQFCCLKNQTGKFSENRAAWNGLRINYISCVRIRGIFGQHVAILFLPCPKSRQLRTPEGKMTS
ncbi:hypothetical protein, partial [Neobacillus vireti]|uniref:hypothetical protein n=1 Tax=Neobacillus vireti TaxID=220686 RepID=UPI002FFFAB88